MKINAHLIKCDENIDLLSRCAYGMMRKTNLEKIVTSSYTGFVILVRKDMETGPRKYPCEGIADGLYALTGFTAYFD